MAYDRWLFSTVGLLALGGLLMVGSSSNYIAMEYGKSPSAFYWKHLIHLVLGFGVLLSMLTFRYQRLAEKRWVLALLVVSFAGLIFVLGMPSVGGAHRWIPLGPFRYQPSELAKLIAIVFIASVLARKEERINDLWSVQVPCAVVVGAMSFLVAIEPDLGSAVMLFVSTGVMAFVAGVRWRTIGVLAGLGVLGFVVGVIAEPYRWERIKAFLDPAADSLGSSFQLNQSLIAIGSGGVFGAGLGQGQQKAFYIPAAHTDFIFSVIGEELGLLGTFALLLAFLVVFWRGLRAALRAPDRFGFFLALGLSSLLLLQALINMCVCLGMVPTKGLPLPFISYGGSSLLASMAATGLLLNVSQYSN